MGLLKTDLPNLYRDPSSGALINTNINEYQRMVRQRKLEAENNVLINKVQSLEGELIEIRNLLTQVVKDGRY